MYQFFLVFFIRHIFQKNFKRNWSQTCKSQGITTSQTMIHISNRAPRKIVWNFKSILFKGNYLWNSDLNFDCFRKWAAVTLVRWYRSQGGIAIMLRCGCSRLHRSNFFQFLWIFIIFEPRAFSWIFLDFCQNLENFGKHLCALSKITAKVWARNQENPTTFVPKNQDCSH